MGLVQDWWPLETWSRDGRTGVFQTAKGCFQIDLGSGEVRPIDERRFDSAVQARQTQATSAPQYEVEVDEEGRLVVRKVKR